MADHSTPMASKVAAAIPYALPVLGGTVGIFYVNSTAHGSPIAGIVLGALIGWGLAFVLAKPLRALGEQQILNAIARQDAE